MRYLGIDYGSKKVGLALSDEAGTMGFPHDIVPNTPRLHDAVCSLIAQEGVGAVVMGDSRDFNGEENPVASSARELGVHITSRCGIPVFYESEVLTSREARRVGEDGEKTRAPKTHKNVDSSAAALILTSYLSKNDHA